MTAPNLLTPVRTIVAQTRILGVDIGNAGGLALGTADGVLVDVEPMPVLADGPKGARPSTARCWPRS